LNPGRLLLRFKGGLAGRQVREYIHDDLGRQHNLTGLHHLRLTLAADGQIQVGGVKPHLIRFAGNMDVFHDRIRDGTSHRVADRGYAPAQNLARTSEFHGRLPSRKNDLKELTEAFCFKWFKPF